MHAFGVAMKTRSRVSRSSFVLAVIAAAAATTGGAVAASYTTPGGDASFRRISATGGKLTGVDLTNALVNVAGQQRLLGNLAVLALGAEQASQANVAGGWLQLGANGMVPAALLPTAYASGSALSASSLGTANGPAVLDASASLSGNFAEATGAPVQRTLAAHFSDTINAADFGMRCDGSTDNAQAWASMLAAYANLASAAKITLPSGNCRTSSIPLFTVNTPLDIEGNGMGPTNVVMTSGGTDAMVFTLANASSLSLHDFTISRVAGATDTGASWPTSRFQGRAIYVSANGNVTGNGGQVQIDRVRVIAGPNENAANNSGQGWAIGIGLTDVHTPEISNSRVFNAPTLETAIPGDTALAATLPMPGSSTNTTTPANLGIGIASDFMVQGAGDYSDDVSFKGNGANGGLVGFDVGDLVQGVYGVNNRATYSAYGLRAEGTNLPELVAWSNGLFNSGVSCAMLNGYNESSVSGNLCIHETWYASPYWAGFWMRNLGWSTLTGNNVLGLYSGAKQGETGIQIDTGAYPMSVSGNTIRAMNQVCVNISANATDASVTGNTTQECSASNINRGNSTAVLMGNKTDTGSISDDGAGNLAISGTVSAGGLQCGGSSASCTINQVTNGTTVFSSDASGNQATTGQASRNVNGSYPEYSSLVFGTVPAGATMQLTPGGAFPAFATTIAAATGASGATSLAVANGAIFAAGMGLKDATTGATATVASVSANTLALAAPGLSAAITSGDSIVNTLAANNELGVGRISANNGVLSERNAYCASGSTRFSVELTQIFANNAASGSMTAFAVIGTLPSSVSFAAGRDGNTGTPYLSMTNGSGGSYACRFDETYAASLI